MTARRTFRGPAALPGELHAGPVGWRAIRRFFRWRRKARRQSVRTVCGSDRGLGGSSISRITPAGVRPRSELPEKVRAREGALFSAVRGRGEPATGPPGIEPRSPLLGLISAQGMSFGGGCGTDIGGVFFVRGAWPAPRGVRSVVSAARYGGFPGPQYLTPLSLPEHFLSDNDILCFGEKSAQYDVITRIPQGLVKDS